MTHGQNSGEDKEILLKIESIAFLIVWLSSYIQLSIFSKPPSLKYLMQFQFLIALGIFFDIFILLFAIIHFLKRRNTSLIPGLGWLIYFMATVFYGRLTFLEVNTSNALLLSFFKGVEFLLLSCFHFLCMFIAGRLVSDGNR